MIFNGAIHFWGQAYASMAKIAGMNAFDWCNAYNHTTLWNAVQCRWGIIMYHTIDADAVLITMGFQYCCIYVANYTLGMLWKLMQQHNASQPLLLVSVWYFCVETTHIWTGL